jgi:hypothetical protein
MPDTLQDALKEALDAEILLDQWDEMPHLHLVLTRPSTGAPYMIPLPIPEHIWEQFIPYEVLSITAEMIKTAPPIELDRTVADIIGLAFFCEGWALKSRKNPTEQETRELQRWAEKHSIVDHPDRIEVKMVTAVTTNGLRYFTTYERGEPEAMEVVVERMDAPEDERKQVDGRVFEAMERLIENFQAKVKWTNG